MSSTNNKKFTKLQDQVLKTFICTLVSVLKNPSKQDYEWWHQRVVFQMNQALDKNFIDFEIEPEETASGFAQKITFPISYFEYEKENKI